MDGLLNISFDEYTSLSISIPTKEEQDQIVLYFSHLDRLLSLHRQKLEKLQSLKKAMLDQMFPSTSKARESEGSEKNKEPEEAASITPYDTKAPTR